MVQRVLSGKTQGVFRVNCSTWFSEVVPQMVTISEVLSRAPLGEAPLQSAKVPAQTVAESIVAANRVALKTPRRPPLADPTYPRGLFKVRKRQSRRRF